MKSRISTQQEVIVTTGVKALADELRRLEHDFEGFVNQIEAREKAAEEMFEDVNQKYGNAVECLRAIAREPADGSLDLRAHAKEFLTLNGIEVS